jgi:hypothetical protein
MLPTSAKLNMSALSRRKGRAVCDQVTDPSMGSCQFDLCVPDQFFLPFRQGDQERTEAAERVEKRLLSAGACSGICK